MMTDDERRRVAERLRKLHLGGGSKDLIERTLSDAIGAWRESGMSWDFITERLADLIDPDTTTDTTKAAPDTTKCDRDALLETLSCMDAAVRWAGPDVERDIVEAWADDIRKALGVDDG